MASKKKSKRYVTIRGNEFEGRDARTATEQAFADRFARIQRDRKRAAVEAREARA